MDDISEMATNPAALGYITGTEVAIGATGVVNSTTAGNLQASTILGTQITGNNGGNAGISAVLPNIYAGFAATDQIHFGLGVTSYYGLGSSFDYGWVGRYQALSANLLTIDILPMVSYRPIPQLTFAAGPIIEYTSARTGAAVDFGTLDQVLFGGAFGGVPGQSDGTFNTTSSGWAAGYLLGAAWEPVAGTRLGVSYRSQIRQALSGDAQFRPGGTVGAGIAAATGAFGVSGFKTVIDLPPVASIGVSQAITPALSLFGDVQWLGWQSLRSLNFAFSNPAQPTAMYVVDLQNSWFFALGARYQITEQIALRAGAAYDRSTLAPNAQRGPLIADSNAYWAALGVEYAPTERLRIDFAYGHIFFAQANLSVPITQEGNTFRGSLTGTVNTGSNYVALQAKYRF
jgi:long-chain fatty acid transport protein